MILEYQAKHEPKPQQQLPVRELDIALDFLKFVAVTLAIILFEVLK